MEEPARETADHGREATLARILREMDEEGRFEASVLVQADGLPVSSASSPFDVEMLAAMVSLVRNAVEQARDNTGLDEVDEVSVVQADKIRLICRYFAVGGGELVLAVVAPPYQTYRRLTNRAIRQTRRTW